MLQLSILYAGETGIACFRLSYLYYRLSCATYLPSKVHGKDYKSKRGGKPNVIFRPFLVRLIGLEPTRRKTPDPKSGASTNFATGARRFAFAGAKVRCFY